MSATENFMQALRGAAKRLKNPGPFVYMDTETRSQRIIVARDRHDAPGVTIAIADFGIGGRSAQVTMDVPTALRVSDAIREAIYKGSGI